MSKLKSRTAVAGSTFDGATIALLCEVAPKQIVERLKITSSETESWLNFTGSLRDRQKTKHFYVSRDC